MSSSSFIYCFSSFCVAPVGFDTSCLQSYVAIVELRPARLAHRKPTPAHSGCRTLSGFKFMILATCVATSLNTGAATVLPHIAPSFGLSTTT